MTADLDPVEIAARAMALRNGNDPDAIAPGFFHVKNGAQAFIRDAFEPAARAAIAALEASGIRLMREIPTEEQVEAWAVAYPAAGSPFTDAEGATTDLRAMHSVAPLYGTKP